MRRNVCLDAIDCLFQILCRRGFDEVRESSMRQTMLTFLLHGQHLHRYMASQRIQFQAVEYRPAEHIWKKDIQRNGGRPVLPDHVQSHLSTICNDALEAFIMREPEQYPPTVRIVVDD